VSAAVTGRPEASRVNAERKPVHRCVSSKRSLGAFAIS
jgi:hypothetical protein